MNEIDRYIAGKGVTVYGGSFTPENLNYPKPLRTGGTVHALLDNWGGEGFQLLSTAPAVPIFRAAPHAGSAWDGLNGVLWVFGGESHGIQSGLDNTMYGWRVSDGKFLQMYDASPISGYRMAADGTYWADAAHTKPWGMHTYRRLRFIPETTEIEVMYDPASHSGIVPIFEQAGQTEANRVPRMWYYNVTTGLWRHNTIGASPTFVPANGAYPLGYSPGYGWFSQDAATWWRMSEAGVISKASVYNKSSPQYHSYMHVFNGIAYQVGGNASTLVYSRHPLANVTNSTKHALANYPAMVGATINNCPSVMMPDGRIIIFGKVAGAYRAFILDPVTDTIVDTGHPGPLLERDAYDLAAEWSTEYRCAIILSRRFNINRVYAYRPE